MEPTICLNFDVSTGIAYTRPKIVQLAVRAQRALRPPRRRFRVIIRLKGVLRNFLNEGKGRRNMFSMLSQIKLIFTRFGLQKTPFSLNFEKRFNRRTTQKKFHSSILLDLNPRGKKVLSKTQYFLKQASEIEVINMCSDSTFYKSGGSCCSDNMQVRSN